MNACVEWSNALEIGIPFVDSDHKVLVSLLGQVHACVAANEENITLGSVFNALDECVELHFAREEKLQELTDSPGLQAHKKEHDDFLVRLHGVCDRFRATPERVSMGDVHRILQDWFTDHIAQQDRKLHDYCGGNADAARQASQMTLVGDDGAGIDWERLRILVVDDNPNFVNLVETLLSAVGVKAIHRADSAHEGLARLSRVNIDLMLVDWIMDDKNGLDFVRELRRGGVDAKMVMVTGFAQPDYAAESRAAGADAFIEKPVSARGMIETLTSVLKD